MTKSLANSKILKRIPKRKKTDPEKDGPEFQAAGKLPLKPPPQKRSLLKPSTDTGRGLLKKRAVNQGEKSRRKRNSDGLDEPY